MTNRQEPVPVNHGTNEIDDMFSDLPSLDPFDLKKEEVATQLAALMVHCNSNRSMLAERLDWKKSRLSQVLSGHGNPTVKTIFAFSRCLGFDFDLVFRGQDEIRPQQPWEEARAKTVRTVGSTSSAEYTVVIQSPAEIFENVARGTANQFYISGIYRNNAESPYISVPTPPETREFEPMALLSDVSSSRLPVFPQKSNLVPI